MPQHETNDQNGTTTSADAQRGSQETTWSTPRDAVRARTNPSTRTTTEKPAIARPKAMAAAAGAGTPETPAQPTGVVKRIARLAGMIVARDVITAGRTAVEI